MTETMTCPSCSEPSLLTAVDRGRVVIDACPRCRGVWLDRGELEKLIALERAADEDFLAEIRGGSPDRDLASNAGGHHDGSNKHGFKSSGGNGRKKKRRGFLGEFG